MTEGDLTAQSIKYQVSARCGLCGVYRDIGRSATIIYPDLRMRSPSKLMRTSLLWFLEASSLQAELALMRPHSNHRRSRWYFRHATLRSGQMRVRLLDLVWRYRSKVSRDRF